MNNGRPTVVRFDAASYLEANAAERGAALAVHDAGRDITFAELWTAVCSLMAELRARGVRPGDVVAVSLPNVWRYVALEIAVPALGAVLLPMPVRLGRREVGSTLQRAGAVLAIADDSSQVGELARAVCVPAVHADDLALDIATSGHQVARPSDPDRIVQIAMTSGTTGLPKLASLSARLKQLTFEGFTSRLGLGREDRMLPMSPITQGVGEMCLYALRTGAALVMIHEARFEPAAVLDLTGRSGATVLGGVPTMLGRLLSSVDKVRPDLSRLRATISAGAPLPPMLARQWEERSGSRTCSFYGAMDIGQLAVPRPGDPVTKRWTTVGQPHDAAEWQICDPVGRPLPRGVEGEICMRGPLVQDRYWDDTGGPYADDGWAHFGDLGLVDDAGFLHVTGRLKDTIIRGGDNVNPLEVENLLREHPTVAGVAVVGRPDADLGERAVAFVVAVPGPALTLAVLTDFLEQQGLARYKWPEQLYLLDVLPTASTGKLDRGALRALASGSTTTPNEGLA